MATASAITTSEAEAPLDLSPKTNTGGDPVGEDLIGYSDDEFAGEPALSSKSGMLDLPGVVEMTGPDAELGIDLTESFSRTETAGMTDAHGLDVLDDENAWDLQANVDTALDGKTPQDADLGPELDTEAVFSISGAGGNLDDEYGDGGFTETHQDEDTVEATLLDKASNEDIARGNSPIASSSHVQQSEDGLHEIDYNDDGVSASEQHDSLNPQVLDDEAVDEDGTVLPDIVNPFADAEDVDDTESNSQKDDQDSADPSRHDSRSIEDRALDEALYGDSSAASLDTPMDGGDLPEVIVSWHGVDYPLLYDSPGSEGKQCFFEDANLLHCAIEELLSNFRRELSDDLTATDELVLQINEMGLEFAESSNHENFREITLDSILQVFNDLVRNKDPDASKPLYAFLITRPSCNSRWHALIEDAYQGKNIEEVSICFPGGQGAVNALPEFADESEAPGESDEEDHGMGDSEDVGGNVEEPIQYPHQDATASGNDEDNLVDDEQFNQELDEYVVIVDEGSEAEGGLDEPDGDGFEAQSPDSREAANATVQLDSVAQPGRSEETVDDQNDATAGQDDVGDGHGASLEGEDGDEGNVEEERDVHSPPQDGNSADFFAHPCYKPEICFCKTCLEEASVKDEEEEADFRLESFGLMEAARMRAAQEKSPARAHPCSRHAYHISDASVSYSITTAADNLPKVLEVSETHGAYLDTETDAANVIVNDPSISDSHAAFDADEVDETKVTYDTSATATLDGDEHADNFNGDFDFDADIGQGLEEPDSIPAEANAGDLDEIDWRDYAGQGDEDVPQESTAASAKRPRSDEDDTADAEHEHDVKRRRSDA